MARRKNDPIIIYGARCTSLKDLAQAVDDMRARATKEGVEAGDVEFPAYVTLQAIGGNDYLVSIDDGEV